MIQMLPKTHKQQIYTNTETYLVILVTALKSQNLSDRLNEA